MIYPSEIHSLSDFQRHTREHVDRLKTTGRPVVLTVNGRAALVVQDAEAYEKLLARVDRLEAIEGIRRGLDSMARGEGQPLDEAFDGILRDLGLRNAG